MNENIRFIKRHDKGKLDASGRTRKVTHFLAFRVELVAGDTELSENLSHVSRVDATAVGDILLTPLVNVHLTYCEQNNNVHRIV